MMTPINPKNEATQKVADDKLSIRFLISDSVLGWRFFPASNAMSAYLGEIQLPEYAKQTIRIACAYVIVKNGKVTHLHRLHISELHLDAEGSVDESRMMAEILVKLDKGPSTQTYGGRRSPDTVSEIDLLTIRKSLGLTSTDCSPSAEDS